MGRNPQGTDPHRGRPHRGRPTHRGSDPHKGRDPHSRHTDRVNPLLTVVVQRYSQTLHAQVQHGVNPRKYSTVDEAFITGSAEEEGAASDEEGA